MRVENTKILFGESVLIKSGTLQAKLKFMKSPTDKPMLHKFQSKGDKTSRYESNCEVIFNDDQTKGKILFENEAAEFFLERNTSYSHYQVRVESCKELFIKRMNKNGQIKSDKKSSSKKYDHNIVGYNGLNEIYVL